ncbi:MAG TPA: HEAT repeat domain-containing protein [Gemmatimonadaceae bacterium]|nr:HEAT repeat domain-containing protein [Gemmatimonadaceae bacterium]
MTMKMITIAGVAAAMTLAATPAPAFAVTQARASYERSAVATRDARTNPADLGAPFAGPDAPQPRQGDPADSLYRRGREAMNRRNYTQAADLFKTMTDRYPKSPSAPSAMYFRAFSLYQTGSADKMRESRDVLTTLSKNYPNADLADAKSLRARVCGELAQRGDAECAEEINKIADRGGDRGDRTRPDRSTSTRSQSSQGERCSDDDDDERVVALNALMQMDSDRALPILKRVLERRDACAYVLRRKAVWLISQKGGDEAADILVQTAKSDPDQETREQAVFWLGQVRSERAITLLEDILKNSPDKEIKDKALFALSQHRSTRAGKALRDFAENEREDEELREQAIFWLGQQGTEDNANYLKGLYSRVKRDALKDKIIFSLSQQHGFGNPEWIMQIALDSKESIEMRKQALFWAGQTGASTESFATLYDKMTDPEIKDQLIFVFSQRGRDAKAIDKLMDIAKNDKDKELRGKAVFWLGQSRDPRALKLLEDLISKP